MESWNKKYIPFLLFLLLFFHHCSTTGSSVREGTQGKENKYSLYSQGLIEENKNNQLKAVEYFKKAYQLDPESEIAKEISSCYLQLTDYSNAEYYLKDSIQRHPEETSLHFSLADIYLVRKEDDDAVDELNRVLDSNATNIEALFKIGSIYQDNNNYHKAISYYKKVLDIKENHTDALFNLGNIYFNLGEKVQARDYFKQILDHETEDLESKFIYAYLLYLTGEYDKALKFYQELHETLPDNETLLKHMAELYYLTQNKENCLTCLREILDRESTKQEKKGEDKLYQAMEQELTGSIQKAKNLFLSITKDNPNDLTANFGLYKIYLHSSSFVQLKETLLQLGKIFYSNENYDEAIKYFSIYKKLAPGNVSVYSYLGIIYDDMGKYDKAIQETRDALRISGNDVKLNYYLGILFEEKKDYGNAVKQFDKVLKFDRRFLSAYVRLGSMYNTLNEDKKSITLLKKALSELPQESDLYLLLGVAYMKEKQYTNAVSILKQGLTYNDKDLLIHFNLANAFDSMQEKSNAVMALKKCLEINPEDPEISNYLAYLYSEMNIHLDEAVELIRVSLDEDRDNYAYLDTAGWIYYRLNALERSAGYLEKARENMEKLDRYDEVVYEHLSEVWGKLNNQEKADQYKARIRQKKQQGVGP